MSPVTILSSVETLRAAGGESCGERHVGIPSGHGARGGPRRARNAIERRPARWAGRRGAANRMRARPCCPGRSVVPRPVFDGARTLFNSQQWGGTNLAAGIVTILLVLVVGFFLAKNLIAKAVVVNATKMITGLQLRIRDLDVGLLNTQVRVTGLTVFNPPEFSKDKILVSLPEIYVHYDLPGFFKGRTHLQEVRLHLDQLTVVRNEHGQVNLNAIKAVQANKSGEAAKAAAPPTGRAKAGGQPQLMIDVLELQVGKVIYKDYSGQTPQVQEYPVNLDERFEHITNPYVLGGLVVSRALAKTTIARLANFDLRGLEQGLSQTMMREVGSLGDAVNELTSGQAVGRTAGQAVKETTDTLKRLLGQ